MSGQRPRGKGEVVLNGPCAERIISHFFPQGGQQWWALWSFSGSLPLCLTLLSILCMLIWANKDACSLPLRGSWQGWNERLYYLLLYLADLSTTPVSTYLLTYLHTYILTYLLTYLLRNRNRNRTCWNSLWAKLDVWSEVLCDFGEKVILHE